MMHPFLWRWLEGGTLRSWGAKSLQESGRRGEPYLTGDGYARIGEGSGSTNSLTVSGVDEAWTTGVQLAEAVFELVKAGAPFTRANLERTYVARRRASWVERELRTAEGARDGFDRGVLSGLIGMGLSGLTRGALRLPGRRHRRPLPSLESYFRDRIPADEIAHIRQRAFANGGSMHDAAMDSSGWPAVPFDGRLLVTHQDALLVGGKVQAAPGYADHVRFTTLGAVTARRVCASDLFGSGDPSASVECVDRGKCVRGACLWNCDNVILGAGLTACIRWRTSA
jgi:electron-transferring-flavoprotein dehydrogenase